MFLVLFVFSTKGRLATCLTLAVCSIGKSSFGFSFAHFETAMKNRIAEIESNTPKNTKGEFIVLKEMKELRQKYGDRSVLRALHFINENGQSDYESLFTFEKSFINENRNIKEHWRSLVNAMKGAMVNSVVPLLQLNEPGRNRCVYTEASNFDEDYVAEIKFQEDKDWEQALLDLGLIKEC